MVFLITGASGSGKSEYAEEIIQKHSETNEKFYIATMHPFGDEGKKKVDKHRKQRAEKNFITVEKYTNIKDINMDKTTKKSILLECISNLTANEMFDFEDVSDRDSNISKVCQKVIEGVNYLKEQSELLVIVSNEVFSDGNEYDFKTNEYIKCLGLINQKLAEMSDVVVEVVYSIPLFKKVEGTI